MARRNKPNDLKDTGLVNNPEPDAIDDPDFPNGEDFETGDEAELREIREDDSEHLVKLLVEDQSINGHVLKAGTVTRMKRGDITNHANAGVPLEYMPDDYDGEVYDTSEPFVSGEKEEA